MGSVERGLEMKIFQRVGSRFVIDHNDDYSGDVKITDTYNNKNFRVPARDLIEFVGAYVRQRKVSELENMSTDELLLGPDRNRDH